MLRILLFPLAVLFGLVTRLRNYFYDRGLKPFVSFEIPVISVGNLTVGGTGKTPMIEHLVRLLKASFPIATLSRGYGRKTKGFRMASREDDATTIGDEPFQLYQKYSESIKVAVGEDRAFAIPNILQTYQDVEPVVLLDDAFQHRRVKPSFSILLTDYNRPFYHDFILPAGLLRESRTGARRADVVIVTKCPPSIAEEEMMEATRSIRRYADKPIFFSKIRYGDPVQYSGEIKEFSGKVILVTGIAHAEQLKAYVQQHYELITHIEHRDHYDYSKKDFEELRTLLSTHRDACILTTEKDQVKLGSAALKKDAGSIPLFCLPIEMEFIKNGEDFDVMVVNSIKREA
jgi:tetraacyldisaccharide 4'-kinase